MGGLRAFVGHRVAGSDLLGRQGSAPIDGFAQRRRIVLGRKAGDRDVPEVGIAKVFAPIGVGELHCLGHKMERLGPVVAELSKRIGLEQIEDLDQVNAAG